MTSLTKEQKELIFDYCVGIASEEESAQAQELIFSNEQAAELAQNLKTAFDPLHSFEHEPCPDELVHATVSRMKDAAHSAQLRLQQLIAGEQSSSKTLKVSFGRNLGRVLLAAAVFYLIFLIYIPPINQARIQADCLTQLQQIGTGLAIYQEDYKGQLPMVSAVDGSPWWKVGYKPDSQENVSNTRHMWLLVRGEYVESPTVFICPGNKKSRNIKYKTIQVAKYYDFPSRNHVTYSFRLKCNKSKTNTATGKKVLVADLNPLFEELPEGFDRLVIQLNKELADINSNNHNRRGQNILFCDGSTKFVRSRLIGDDQDDIFTLRNIDLYEGNETPSNENDNFVAP